MAKSSYSKVAQASWDPASPEVPAITELVDLNEEDLALINLWETATVGSRLLMGPPGMPKDRLDFLRSLADNWAQDEQFQQAINDIAGYDAFTYKSGEDTTKELLEISTSIEEFIDIFIELIEK